MAMPLYAGALDGVSGEFVEDSAFHVDAEAARVYDQSFPQNEQPARVPARTLTERLPPAACGAFEEAGIRWLQDLNRRSGEEMARWPGMDDEARRVVNEVLQGLGYPKKAWAWRGTAPVYTV